MTVQMRALCGTALIASIAVALWFVAVTFSEPELTQITKIACYAAGAAALSSSVHFALTLFKGRAAGGFTTNTLSVPILAAFGATTLLALAGLALTWLVPAAICAGLGAVAADAFYSSTRPQTTEPLTAEQAAVIASSPRRMARYTGQVPTVSATGETPKVRQAPSVQPGAGKTSQPTHSHDQHGQAPGGLVQSDPTQATSTQASSNGARRIVPRTQR